MPTSRSEPTRDELLHKAWALSLESAEAVEVEVTDDALRIRLMDGRELSVPIVWLPRVSHATREERENVRIIAGGAILEWPDLDDGVEIAHLLLGWKSGESDKSLKRWLDERAARKAS